MNINLAYSKQKGILIQTVDTKRKETMNHQYWNMEKLSFIKGYMQSYCAEVSLVNKLTKK